MPDAATYANAFKAVMKAAAERAKTDKEKLDAKIQSLQEKSEEIAEQIKAVTKELADIDDAIAVGLKHAASEQGVKLEIGGGGRSKKKTGGTGTPEQIEAGNATAIAWLKKHKGYHSAADIKEGSGAKVFKLKGLTGIRSQGKSRGTKYTATGK